MNEKLPVFEINFDCLVGPTHNFAGLSFGNRASLTNQKKRSNPKKAALQGLRKMRFLMHRGFWQGVLPPHERPHFKSFHNLGFKGSETEILRNAYSQMPRVFFCLCSSSFMWAANAAMVSPSSDTNDGLVHLSPANLVSMLHRSIEHDFTHRVLKLIFDNERHFVVHPALLSQDLFSDEGAANHNRLCKSHENKGLEIFVYGKESTWDSQKTSIFPCRQSMIANAALATRHTLATDYVFNIAQNPLAIDQGAFHNDVVCVMNENVILCHEWAFFEQKKILAEISDRFRQIYNEKPVIIEITNEAFPIEDAVKSYLFNSQLLTKNSKKMLLFAPYECLEIKSARTAIKRIVDRNNPIDEVQYFDISESMANGGGPACLRLRVVLNEEELKAIKQSTLLSDSLYHALTQIIDKYYVDELTLDHFFDQVFLDQAKKALEEIALVLGLGKIYNFQQ